MTNQLIAIPPEADRVVSAVRDCLGDALVSAYLHGSAVAGGLRPSSDLDVLVVTGARMTRAMRHCLLAELLRISGRVGDRSARPVELIVFYREDLEAAAYPLRCELMYGEWLREAFEAGEIPMPVADPELTILLAQARQNAKALIGPAAAKVLPAIPMTELKRAIGDSLTGLLETLDGDERNVLLTLARMWRTVTTGEIVPKDVAAEWAILRLPAEAAELVAHARGAYVGVFEDDWRPRRNALRDVASDLRKRIEAML